MFSEITNQLLHQIRLQNFFNKNGEEERGEIILTNLRSNGNNYNYYWGIWTNSLHFIVVGTTIRTHFPFCFVFVLSPQKKICRGIFFSCVIMAHKSSPSTPSNMDYQLLGQKISVMKTKALVFPEKWYLKNSTFWHSNSCFVLKHLF